MKESIMKTFMVLRETERKYMEEWEATRELGLGKKCPGSVRSEVKKRVTEI